MNKKIIKKLTAAAMAFSMIGGAVSVPTGDKPLFGSNITANAAGPYASLNGSTGVLTIGGEINKNMLEPYSRATSIVADEGTVLPEDCSKLFEFFGAKEIDLSKADTSKVKNMYSMFGSCYYLTSVNLSNFNTKNVTNMAYLFYDCELESIDLSGFDTSNVENMRCMFYMCDKLKELDLSSFNTKNVTDMADMFYNCQSLKSLDLSNFDTSSVKNMGGMFTACQELKEIDLSSFDTGNVENMNMMFYYCSSLSSLDVSNFNTSNVNMMRSMFNECTSLSTLDLSSFTVGKDTDARCMFMNSPSLQSNICRVIGRTVTLDGYIGANIYLQPCEKLAKVVMSGPNGDKELTDFSGVIQEDGTYKFSYPINAAQADELITLKAYDKDGNRLIVCDHKDNLLDHSQASCTVYGYIDEIKKDDVYSEPKLAKLVDGLENYCKAADNYFDGTEKTIEGIDSVKAEDVADYAPMYGNDVKLSLVLNSATAMRLYLNADNVMLGDSVLAPKTGKYGTYREISNIPAQKLSSAYDVIADGTEYKFVPLSYVYRVLNNANASKQLTEIAKATYVYATAAEAYAAK